jgi:5-deoxy-glucuronate isomerase
MIRTAVFKLCGQLATGPTAVFDQSSASINAPISPPPEKTESILKLMPILNEPTTVSSRRANLESARHRSRKGECYYQTKHRKDGTFDYASSMQHLAYGRIILNASYPAEAFSTGERETGLIVLSGEATATVEGNETALGRYDAIYIPRDSSVKVATATTVDLAEFSADVGNRCPLQVVRFAELADNPGLRFSTGGPGNRRQLNMLLAKNVTAGRLIAGFTESEQGNWTSWPPHEHAAMLEEMYVYFDMPDPAYGIQLVYNDTHHPELVTVVRDGDAVMMPSGFHPNVY